MKQLISVGAGGYRRFDKPVEVVVDVTPPFCVVEVSSSGEVVDNAVPFQMDRGLLTFMMAGTTEGDATRYFELRSGEAQAVVPLLALNENAEDETFAIFCIGTSNATYFYHKTGGGFSSLIDVDGNDWIGYHPWGGSDGNYRGIPNLVHPESYFHPGRTTCVSDVITKGPVKVTLHSRSEDNAWACQWDIFPTFATLTVLKVAREYWFLYEGTPGGELDEANDYGVCSDGTRFSASESWIRDLPDPEWLYFGSGNCQRVLYLIHHDDDNAVASYRPMQSNMTVFGFGREKTQKFLTGAPNTFTIGFAETDTFDDVQGVIDSAFRPLQITQSVEKTR